MSAPTNNDFDRMGDRTRIRLVTAPKAACLHNNSVAAARGFTGLKENDDDGGFRLVLKALPRPLGPG